MAWSGKSKEAILDNMKPVLIGSAKTIGTMIYEVTMNDDNPNIRGWISLIEGFEAQMIPYLDEEYFAAKNKIVTKMNEKEKPSRRKLFKSWLDIYSLLCQKMQSFGAYPLTPYEEVQEHEHPEYIFEDEDSVERLG